MIAPVLLSAVPLLAVIALLALGRGAVTSSLVGLGLAVVLGLTVFPVDAGTLTVEGLDFLPVVVEVTLILLTGVVLARLLGALGAMTRISDWVLAASPGPTAGAVLIVFGIVPFAESVTGFGIGITVGIPILVHLGFGIRKASVLGLLGMVAAPWGGLAPGAKVASGLLGIPLTELGIATAQLQRPPGVRRRSSPHLRSARQAHGPPLQPYRRCRAERRDSGASTHSSALPSRASSPPCSSSRSSCSSSGSAEHERHSTGSSHSHWSPTASSPSDSWSAARSRRSGRTRSATLLTSPPVWLAAGCLAAIVAHAQPRARHRRRRCRGGLRAWVPVGVATASFMVMGWSLSVFDMSTRIGEALSAFGVWTVPALGHGGLDPRRLHHRLPVDVRDDLRVHRVHHGHAGPPGGRRRHGVVRDSPMEPPRHARHSP